MTNDKETADTLREVQVLLSRIVGGTPVANLSNEIKRVESKVSSYLSVPESPHMLKNVNEVVETPFPTWNVKDPIETVKPK